MNVLDRVKQVLDAEKNDVQLDKFLADVRDSLAGSNRQFLSYLMLVLGSIVTSHLVVYGGGKDVSINGIKLADSSLFRKTFLIVPAASLACMAAVGYLRRLQREVFDYLSISRFRALGQSGLHDLRLPGDYLLGFFLLGIEEGRVGRIIRFVVVFLLWILTTALPIAYIEVQSKMNMQVFGSGDLMCDAASGLATLLCIIALSVVFLAERVKPV